MAIQNNQLVQPFTTADKSKLDGITPGAQPQPATASQAEAEAGLDNVKMMTPLRVKQSIDANAGSGSGNAITGVYLNSSGSSIPALTLVSQSGTGTLLPVVTNDADSIDQILGLLTQTTANTATGSVTFDGLVTNITTSFVVGDVIYLGSNGVLTTDIPDYGVDAFAAGYFVVKVGKITKNSSNPAQKDFLVKIENLGAL